MYRSRHSSITRCLSSGSVTGQAISTRRIMLRFIQSALDNHTWSSSPICERNTRECSSMRPMTERTRTLSVTPGTPAGKMQAPRTITSTLTPHWDAWASARASGSSVSAFIFSTIDAGTPASAAWLAASMRAISTLCRWNGAIRALFRWGSLFWLARCRNTCSTSCVSAGSAVRWLMSVYNRAVPGL